MVACGKPPTIQRDAADRWRRRPDAGTPGASPAVTRPLVATPPSIVVAHMLALALAAGCSGRAPGPEPDAALTRRLAAVAADVERVLTAELTRAGATYRPTPSASP